MSALVIALHLPTRENGSPAGLHYDPNLMEYDRPMLHTALSERGWKMVITRGLEAYDHEARVADVFVPEAGATFNGHVGPARIKFNKIAAIRSIGTPLGGGLPELNSPDVRTFVQNEAAVGSMLGALSLESGLPEEPSEPIVRAYSFGHNDEGEPQTYFVERAADLEIGNPNSQPWTLLNQKTVPDEIKEKTAALTQALKTETDQAEILAGFDITGDHVKVHARDVLFVRKRHDYMTARRLYGMAADQLIRVAEHKKDRAA